MTPLNVETLEATNLRSASGVRWRILTLLFVISMVTYLDRVNISIAATHMMREFNLSAPNMGKVFSAFVFAYGIFQLPGGWLGDRFGPRVVLSAAIAWWSLFTLLTALVANIFPLSLLPIIVSLIIVRFCLGVGEAAAFPNFNRTIANWIPATKRAFASSVPLAGGGLGAALTPPLIAWLIIEYGWRESFYACAVLGLVVAGVWYWYSRDRADQHTGVNELELNLIRGSSASAAAPESLGQGSKRKTPWSAILSARNVWVLTLINFCCGYVVYIYLTWFYVYLVEARKLSFVQGSFYTTGPFIAITVMTPLGGALCDRAARRFGKRIGRRLIGLCGMAVAGAALAAGAQIENINLAIVALSLGAGAVFVSFAAQWVSTIDICQPHAGVVSGIMNWGGNSGGMISPIVMPILAQRWGWTVALQIAAAVILLGSLLWWLLQADKPINIGETEARQ
jgi:ACS family glucarate transporter-like MFS transporter